MTLHRSIWSSRRRIAIVAVACLCLAGTGAGLVSAAGKADIPAVRAATLKYKDINRAFAEGYVMFYQCTEEPGVGTMGQHLLNPDLAGTPEVDPLRPEVLVYQPTRSGGYRLVGVEYVVPLPVWDPADEGRAPPTVLGQTLSRLDTHRYPVPFAFYQRHLWLWQGNPLGLFADWNPTITCLGQGDEGG